MDIRTEHDTEVYEVPMLDEIGGFAVMTRFGGENDDDRYDGFPN